MKKVILAAFMMASAIFAHAQEAVPSYFPQGSYTQTCHQCTFDGTYLECYCLSIAQQYKSTIIDWKNDCAQLVANHDGYLACSIR